MDMSSMVESLHDNWIKFYTETADLLTRRYLFEEAIALYRKSLELNGLQDDPYRSLVWKLKKEGVIQPAPLIPFHEFRWGAWLRSRPLPPFSSERLEPAMTAARALARSDGARHLAGWKGHPQTR